MCPQTKSKDIHFYILVQGEADHLFTMLGDRTKCLIFIHIQRVDSIEG